MSEPAAHPAPHRHKADFGILLFGASAAPLMWMGHLWLSYGLSSSTCFPGDLADAGAAGAGLRSALTVFDVGAVIVSLIGLAISWRSWRATRNEAEGHAIEIGEGRMRFLAIWGILSSLLFLAAIAFAVIASFVVPLCGA
jgi:hypothetical protein